MATTTEEARTLTRERKIDRYVVRAALEDFLGHFIEEAGVSEEPPITLKADEEKTDEEVQAILTELSGPLFNELWPDDEGLDREGYRLAEVKADALVARMFADVAAAEPGWAARAAAHHVCRVEQKLAKGLAS